MHLPFRVIPGTCFFSPPPLHLGYFKGTPHSTVLKLMVSPDLFPFWNPDSLPLHPQYHWASRSLPLLHSQYPNHHPILFPESFSKPSNLFYLHHAHLPWSNLVCGYGCLIGICHMILDHSKVLLSHTVASMSLQNTSGYIIIPFFTCLPLVLLR